MNLEKALDHALQAAAGADEIMMRYYKTDYRIEKKKGARSRAEQVLTEPDLKCDVYLREYLTSQFPQTTVVTEESTDLLHKDWHDNQWIWYVDPIDGSLSYLEGSDCFGVSIALCRDGVPVLGVITNPALQIKSWAFEDGGAYYNDSPVTFTALPENNKPVLMLSNGQNMSRSYRLALDFLRPDELLLRRSVVTKSLSVLAGEADYYFSLPWEVFHGGAPNVWDLAGAAAIFREAGGLSINCYGKELIFDKKSYRWHQGHIFGNPDVREFVLPNLGSAIDRRREMDEK